MMTETEKNDKWKKSFIPAVVKEITITVDIIHGWDSKIREIYVPSEGVFFNSEACGVIHLGRYDKAKEIGNVTVAKNLVETIKDYLKAKEKFEDFRENYTKGYLKDILDINIPMEKNQNE